jgi:hypothetical protein
MIHEAAIYQRVRFVMCSCYKRGHPCLINAAVRSCRPILRAAAGCHSSCHRKLGSLRIGCFGALGLLLGALLLGALQLRLGQHSRHLGYREVLDLVAGDGRGILHTQLAEIVVEEVLIQPCSSQILVGRLETTMG